MFSEWVEVEARCVVVFDGFRCVGKRELRRVNSVIEEMGWESCRGCETSFLSREELRKFLILLNEVKSCIRERISWLEKRFKISD